ncbi:unnamed protein product [Prorocentrum cordatum]|uniref:Calmodulin n=1 Tax=Prorocentrum cordatum TaxID=2364126 RepID=A0ABN9T8X9_9DINO|nr:unnamed protein product [Polarella glacialis]
MPRSAAGRAGAAPRGGPWPGLAGGCPPQEDAEMAAIAASLKRVSPAWGVEDSFGIPAEALSDASASSRDEVETAEAAPTPEGFLGQAEVAFGSVTRAYQALCSHAAHVRPEGTAAVSNGAALDVEDFAMACLWLELLDGDGELVAEELFKGLDADGDRLLTVTDLLDVAYFPVGSA